MRDMINAAAFKESILCAYAALQADIQAINDLNVFPVPDGDTGTNMGLTMEKAAMELRKNDFPTVSAAADCVASALLRGARGNSGVILSLLFRGISRKLKGLHEADAKSFAAALHDGVEAAYKAVMKPAEGTILTVSRLAAEAAVKTAEKDAGLEKTFEAAIKAGDEALADTINLNPVLKKAGVVDAGGMGFMVILKAMFASLKGEVFARLDQIRIEEVVSDDSGNGYDPRENITFAFDTVYIVRKKTPDVDLEPLRAYLDSIGDSLVISDDDEIFKVHVHTDTPGDALNESQKYGTLEVAKIENMVIQADQNAAGEKVISTEILQDVEKELEAKEAEPEYAEPEKQFGAVVVAAGPGMQKLFRELGADRVVTGGQTMNPSTDDILREINRTPAETVFVLPNNKNIIMAAEQAGELVKDKRVIVIPTKTVPQGISALLNFNIDENEEPIVEAMKEAAANVHTAMVTYAARDSDFDGHDIHAGEYLALLDGALLGSCGSEESLLQKLREAFGQYDPSFLTVYYGEGVEQDAAQKLAETIAGDFPDAELSVVDGGQPVYYYMISVE
ncbi:MAG: DAK2 domain-containing protein [Oscillospiraceae bacterium]|nr:DAK2 domain-containing protein [Oscillospiraceae bacterium]